MDFSRNIKEAKKHNARQGILLLCLLGIILVFSSCATPHLQQQVENFIADKPAQFGVAIDYNGKSICNINGKKRFPMMSVFKLHQDTQRCSDNFTTPRDAILLLKKAYGNEWLRTYLSECKTGQNRIPALLPPNTIVGHKTGTGDKTPEGRYRGINDIGFIELPNGHHIFIAIFCDESEMTMEKTEAVIAEIARMAYSYFSRIVPTTYSDLVPILNFAPQMPIPELT